MAHATQSPTGNGDEITLGFPKECCVPGYWATIAENATDWAPVVSASPYWRTVNGALENWKREYQRERGGVLFRGAQLPQFVGKSEARIKEKTIQKIKSSATRDEEIKRIFDQSAPVPRLEDLVRVRVETHFLDGVPFLAKKLLEVAKTHDGNASLEAKGKVSGYFAQHLTLRLPVHFRFNGSTTSCDVTCEIQVATSLATLVWENSHDLYQHNRMRSETLEEWQWNPNDPRFLGRQLGHMIHLADGLFCNLRDKGLLINDYKD